MKTLFKVLLFLVLLLGLSGVGGYFYMKRKFAPPTNQLRIAGLPATGALRWLADTVARPAVPHAGLLVPIRLPSCPRTCYLQLDTGAPYTVLYAHQLTALRQRYPALGTSLQLQENVVPEFRFALGSARVVVGNTRVLINGTGKMPADSLAPFIIGSLGTDALEGRVLVLDYAARRFTLGTEVPASLAARATFAPLAFPERRLLLTAALNGEPRQLLFDSGTSAYTLLTSQENWLQLAASGAAARTDTTNSWGKKLLLHTAPTAARLGFGPAAEVALGTVAYMEGMNLMQQTLMRFSGLDGMLGNEPFAAGVLVLDVKGGRYGVAGR
ncbi:hypothetical protein [Hymenobacter psychrophilus]|uniref:Aspartyl protease n=1 Tax=Hymenobacter psychrophilus TaxID=651662 RepID=A0A1H3CT56_9BACT|nr:hypothetical protein [Hymenobacter psychrophilus]SDX57327.1 hypothetical protein SAMN04488069_102105 [Hymenobacter psychrophilus]